MRFLLYNIRYATGSNISFHLPLPFFGYFRKTHNNFAKIIDFVDSKKPDIVGLVEVDNGSFRNNYLSQVHSLAEKLDHYHIFNQKYSDTSFLKKVPVTNSQGNAFLTSNNIHHHKFHFFECGVKRLVIELELDEVAILLVHLSIKAYTRKNQLKELVTIIKNIDKPVILAGDFNPLWGDKEIKKFAEISGMKNANINHKPTFPSYSPRKELDYIFTSPGIKVNHFEVPDIKLSDHLPLICDFELE